MEVCGGVGDGGGGSGGEDEEDEQQQHCGTGVYSGGLVVVCYASVCVLWCCPCCRQALAAVAHRV